MSFDLQAAVQEGANRAGQDLSALWPSELGSMRLEKPANQPYIIGVQGREVPLFAVVAKAQGEDLEVRISFPVEGVPNLENDEPLPGVNQDQLHQAIVVAVAGIIDQERRNEAIKAWIYTHIPVLPEDFPLSRLESIISNDGVLLALRSLPEDKAVLVSVFELGANAPITMGAGGEPVEEEFPEIEGFTDIQVYRAIDILKDWVTRARKEIGNIQYGGVK